MAVLVGLNLYTQDNKLSPKINFNELFAGSQRSVRLGMGTFSCQDWTFISSRLNQAFRSIEDLLEKRNHKIRVEEGRYDHNDISFERLEFNDMLELVSPQDNTFWNSVYSALAPSKPKIQSHLHLTLGLEYIELFKKKAINITDELFISESFDERPFDEGRDLIHCSKKDFDIQTSLYSFLYSDYFSPLLTKESLNDIDYFLMDSRTAHALYVINNSIWDDFIDENPEKDSNDVWYTIDAPEIPWGYPGINTHRLLSLQKGNYLSNKKPVMIGCNNITNPWQTYFEISEFIQEGNKVKGCIEHVQGKQIFFGRCADESSYEFTIRFDPDHSDYWYNQNPVEFQCSFPSPHAIGTAKFYPALESMPELHSQQEIPISGGIETNEQQPTSFESQSILSKDVRLNPTELAERGLQLIHNS